MISSRIGNLPREKKKVTKKDCLEFDGTFKLKQKMTKKHRFNFFNVFSCQHKIASTRRGVSRGISLLSNTISERLRFELRFFSIYVDPCIHSTLLSLFSVLFCFVCIRDSDMLYLIWRYDFRLKVIFATASNHTTCFKRGQIWPWLRH